MEESMVKATEDTPQVWALIEKRENLYSNTDALPMAQGQRLVIPEYSAPELLELGESFKQAMEEPIAAWLVRLWHLSGQDQPDCCGGRETGQCNCPSLLTAA